MEKKGIPAYYAMELQLRQHMLGYGFPAPGSGSVANTSRCGRYDSDQDVLIDLQLLQHVPRYGFPLPVRIHGHHQN